MQIDLDALERDAREKVLSTGHTFLLPETLLALIAKVRELERRSAAAYQNGMADERGASDQYAKGWNDARRATDGQRDTARGVPEGWKLVPVELTGEMAAAGKRAGGVPRYAIVASWGAMLAAAPTPPDGDAERKRADAFVREFEDWVKQTGALPWGGSWMAEVSSIIERAAMAASKGSDDGR